MRQNASCPEWISALQNLKNLRDQLNEIIKDAGIPGSYRHREVISAKCAALRKQINEILEKLKYEIDPYQVRLRDRLARKLNAQYISAFHDGYAIKMENEQHKGDRWSYINKKGEALKLADEIGGGISTLGNFVNGIACIYHASGAGLVWSYLKKDGTLVKGLATNGLITAGEFHDGIAVVQTSQTKKYFYIDQNGNNIFESTHPEGFNDAKEFHDGFAAVMEGDKWFYIDRQGQKAVLKGDRSGGVASAHNFSEGVARILLLNPYGRNQVYIGKNGNRLGGVFAEQVRDGGDFKDGIAWVQLAPSNKYFCVDKFGNKVILKGTMANGVDYADDFRESLARVRIGNKWFYIDKNGEVLQEGLLKDGVDDASDFQDGIGRIKKGKKWFCIDRKGENLLQGRLKNGLDYIGEFHEGIAVTSIAKKQFYLKNCGNQSFKEIVPTLSGSICNYNEGVAKLSHEKGITYFDRNGKEVFCPSVPQS